MPSKLYPFEEWRPIPDWPAYEVSSLGRFCRILTRGGRPCERFLKPLPDTSGYFSVVLSREGEQYRVQMHRTVCGIFHGPAPSPRHQTRHLDGNRLNIGTLNLQWGTPKENSDDKIRHGRTNEGERNGSAKLTAADIAVIRGSLEKKKTLALRFSVSSGLITMIQRRKIWRHLP